MFILSINYQVCMVIIPYQLWGIIGPPIPLTHLACRPNQVVTFIRMLRLPPPYTITIPPWAESLDKPLLTAKLQTLWPTKFVWLFV